jgi:hypothetical protein
MCHFNGWTINWIWTNFGYKMINFQDTLFVKNLHYQSNIDYLNLTANYSVHPVHKMPVFSASVYIFARLRKVMVCPFSISTFFDFNGSAEHWQNHFRHESNWELPMAENWIEILLFLTRPSMSARFNLGSLEISTWNPFWRNWWRVRILLMPVLLRRCYLLNWYIDELFCTNSWSAETLSNY